MVISRRSRRRGGAGLGGVTRRRQRAADLVRQRLEARDTGELTRLQQRLLRVDVRIFDARGFVPFDRTGGALLFNLITDRYERRATSSSPSRPSPKGSRCMPATRTSRPPSSIA